MQQLAETSEANRSTNEVQRARTFGLLVQGLFKKAQRQTDRNRSPEPRQNRIVERNCKRLQEIRCVIFCSVALYAGAMMMHIFTYLYLPLLRLRRIFCYLLEAVCISSNS